ncbi:spermatogenesis-associated protein 7 isoform X2 [Salarias fasciatus]|uniref:spermatogenesis-associated protein 7 isoform X2 n=1 Tax=Salarias fasciatus TaxID=181472 RepID=UPI00117679CA|nr:spermatogenesis-associated protein 7 isoform X2 [Salarias fasciatus]
MGYARCNVIMESRTGSVSSGLGSSTGVRGQTLKSSPFCPRSSSKLTQSIIKDHMVSHYKKVYSAKAAIDASVPKSMLCSVKYNDRIRQERLRKGSRPQSAHSLSHRNSRTSCSSAPSRSSVQYDDSPYYCSRSSSVSSPRLTTSFNVKDIAYPSCKINSHPTRPASEIKYRSPEATLQRKQSTCSLGALGDQSSFRTFQDPVQKTYSGDLLQKHSQHFTQHKPFTPKTLISDKSSYLSKYRFYRAPQRKITQDYSNTKLAKGHAYHGSTKNKGCTQDFDEPSQELVTEHEWSEDDFNDTYFSSSRQQSRVTKSRNQTFLDFSPGEEELLYLEFISAVTEDILSRGHFSDRVIERVMERHIDMNLHKLDEGKMRHLLEVMRKDLEQPTNIPNSELDKKDTYHLDSLPGMKDSQVKSKEDSDMFPYVSLIKSCNSSHYDEPIMASTPTCSPERFTPTEIKEDRKEEEEAETGPLLLSEHLHNDAGAGEEDAHQTDTVATNEVSSENHEYTSDKDQADVQFRGQSEAVEDLGRNLSELLHVSSGPHREQAAAATENTNTADSVTDDEF